ncbi:MAG: 3-oxoacyl-[acyl-carrier protein] reductase [Bryobacterales bacterium]|nr:3-oxoacyl-[acyl-carrier protein] reductase [Bryobacterales bacterium]
MSLNQKVILVTGGAKRIGRSIALALAAEGARVAIHYGESEAEARQTAKECGGAPVFQADLESVAEIRALFDRVAQHFGTLDGLVNNAARFTRFDPLAIEEGDWDFIHSVNLKSVFFCCQAAAKIMLAADGGHIVNISSLGALKPWAHHAHYCASKAGVVMLTKALAKAWAPQISVNTVAPGVIPFDKTDERIERFISATPAGRAGTGNEVALAVLGFLRASRFTTGQLMAVDGGLSLR